MKTAISSTTTASAVSAKASAAPSLRPHSGRLAQLATMMNQSPQVQAQLSLADEIQNSEPVQRQMALGVEINHVVPVQPRRMEEEDSAQHQEAPIPNRTGLPDQLKAGVENLSGISLDDVKVHYNSAKPAQLNALAYAQGTDIHVASGQEKHLPHEAWHIVQQAQGRVKPTMQMRSSVPVNDDPRLELEADVMGARAMASPVQCQTSNATGNGAATEVQRAGKAGVESESRIQDKRIRALEGEAPSNLMSAESSVPDSIVQRQAIKSAGLELELKGVVLTKGFDKKQNFGPKEKVIDKGDWWIEVDAQSPELVTKPTERRGELFEWLTLGHDLLKDIQLLAQKAAEVNAIPAEEERSEEAMRLVEEYHTILIRVGLPLDADAGLYVGKEFLAKPQISFGIKKGHLSNFAQSVMGPKITYTEGYTKAGEKYENAEWPRVNPDVQKIYNSSPIWQNEHGKAFLTQLSTASTEAKGLSLMTIIIVLFATRKQDPSDVWQYYKARFSVMPRVPLSELYDALEGPQQVEYKNLMNLWLNAIVSNNEAKDESSEGYHPDKIYRAKKDKSIHIDKELQSIELPSKRHKKTLKEKEKQVDAISSDALASTQDVGASVGALDLPEQSSGIFEIRSMPYILIQDYANVETIFAETIAAYGGME